MNGFMGYDSDRVARLRTTMHHAEFELDGFRSSDTEAGTALSDVRRVQRMLRESWLPLLDSLLVCKTLTNYRPTRLETSELTTSRLGVLEHTYGWSIVTDPLTSASNAITIDQAQALGWTLSHVDVKTLISDHELAWLAMALTAIAKRPALVDAFLVNMTNDGWTRLCNQLGDGRIALVALKTVDGQLNSTELARLADIDSIFRQLGAVLFDERRRHRSADAAPVLATMNPYAAAMIVQTLQLSASELAAVSVTLIRRYRTGGWADVQRAGPGTADILMQTMIHTPGAPAVFVSRTAHDPALLFDSAHSSALAQALIALGTNPANMTTATAGAVIPDMVRYIRDSYNSNVGFYGRQDPTIGLFAVDLVAPWLLQFAPSHASDWSLSSSEGPRLLASVMIEPSAFSRLVTQRAAIAAGLSHRIASSGDMARHSVEDLAAMLALIDTLARQRTVDHTHDAQQVWDIGFSVIDASLSLLPAGGAAQIGSGVALAGLRQVLVSNGLAPRSAAAVAHETLYVLDWQTTVAAAAVICATFDHMVSNGRITAMTPPPPLPDPGVADPGAQFSVAFSAWLDVCALGQAGLELDAIKQTIASTHEAERNAVDLATG